MYCLFMEGLLFCLWFFIGWPLSSNEGALCRRRESTKIITFDHRGFVGLQAPATHLPPASIRSSEVSYLAQSCAPAGTPLIGADGSIGTHLLCHLLNRKCHSSEEWHQITHFFSCIRSYKFMQFTPNASQTSGILGSLLVGLLGFRFLLRSSMVTMV